MESIKGKVVVITGASSGLGEATARHLSAQGATVVLGARRVEGIHSLAAEMESKGGQALASFYEQTAIPAESFARAVAFAMSQPEDVDVNEILFRPTRQEL